MPSFLREHKTLLVVLAVGLLLLELEIFAIAAMRSGRKATLQVLNHHGALLYESDGHNLSSFDRHYFEKTFGPLSDYEVRLSTREEPFPFRAWFVAAVGLPVGAALLLAFLVRAWAALFHTAAPASAPAGNPDTAPDAGRLERLLARAGRLNIFAIGFLVLLAVLAYWIVPNLIVTLGRLGVETLTRYRWIILGLVIIGLGVGVWVIYLRYLLAKQTIASHAAVEKYRLELEYRQGATPLPQLEHHLDHTGESSAPGREERPPTQAP
jgi:hypothetical protein